MTLPGSEKTRTRMGLVLVLLAAAVLLLASLGGGGLTDPDESAYAESVREMAQRGDWIVPHLYGKPLLDKPILYYWILGASFRLFGESELAARLPSVLAALVVLLAVYRLAWRIHESRTAALVASLSLATSLEFILLGRAAVTDMILTAFCTLAILCYVETLLDPARKLLPLAGAACVGLAVLTKGPLGLVLPALVLGGYLLATRSLGRLRDLRPVAGLLVLAAVAAPWYAAIGMLRPDLVREFFVGGNVGRFLTPEHRSQSPLYYLVVLAIGFLPWSAFLPAAVGRALVDARRRAAGYQRRILPVVWLLLLLLFFTLAASKLPSYILPAFPAAAILAAAPLRSWLRPPGGGRREGMGAMIALVLLAAAMALFTWKTDTLGAIPLEFKLSLLPLCGAALAGTLIAFGALAAGWSRISYLLLAGGNGAVILCLLIFGFPQLEPWKSSREAAATVASQIRPGDRVVLYRENDPGFAYYLRRVPELVHREGALVESLESGNRLYCLMGRERYEKLRVRRPELQLYLLRSVGNSVVITNLPPGGSP